MTRRRKLWSNWGQTGRECGRVLSLSHSEGALELPPIGPNWSTGAAQCPAVESTRQLKIYLTVWMWSSAMVREEKSVHAQQGTSPDFKKKRQEKHSADTVRGERSAWLSISRCSLGFIRLCSICLLASFPSFCSISSILIPVIAFEPICLILQIAHLFDRYPIDSSENNGGSSSFNSFSFAVHSSRSHTLLNNNTHTRMHAHASAEW